VKLTKEDEAFLRDAYDGNVVNIKKYLERNLSQINICDNYGETALIKASYAGNQEIVKLLLENGANFNLEDNYGMFPIHFAADQGYIEIIKLLLNHGESLMRLGTNLQTVLHYAVHEGRYDTINYILESNINFIKFADKNGATPLELANKLYGFKAITEKNLWIDIVDTLKQAEEVTFLGYRKQQVDSQRLIDYLHQRFTNNQIFDTLLLYK